MKSHIYNSLFENSRSFRKVVLKWARLLYTCIFLLAIITLEGCLVTPQTVILNKESQEIPLYSGDVHTSKEYGEIVHIELTGSIFTSRKRMRDKLIKQAIKHDCDAVINVEFKTTFIWPQAFGIGIKYKKSANSQTQFKH